MASLKNESAYFISHDADIDGMGPIIIGRMAFGKVDHSLVNYKNIDDVIKQLIADGVFENYDHVFITDVCPKKETIDILDALNEKVNSPLESKIYLIDHHAAAQDRNGYKFAEITVMNGTTKTCATSLVFEKLKGFLDKKVITNTWFLSELTRLSDTWDWHELGVVEADDLAELFNCLGAEKYLESMTEKMQRTDFKADDLFTYDEAEMVRARKAKMLSAYEEALKSSKTVMVNGKRVLVCNIDYEFRNGLSQHIRDRGTDCEILAIPDFKKGTMSFRVLDGVSDCNKFAQEFGGGGNAAAAGSPIDQKVIEAFGFEKPDETSQNKDED